MGAVLIGSSMFSNMVYAQESSAVRESSIVSTDLKGEEDKLYDETAQGVSFGDVSYGDFSSMDAVRADKSIVSLEKPEDIIIKIGEKLKLPETVAVLYSDNTPGTVSVVWNEEDTAKADINAAGEYAVSGVVAGYDGTVTVMVIVKTTSEEILASLDGYTEGGSSASRTAAKNAENNERRVRIKYTDGNNHAYSRRAYFQFPLDNLDIGIDKAELRLVLQSGISAEALTSTYYVGAVEEDLNSLTWQGWETWEEPEEKVAFTVNDNFSAASAGGVITVDVTQLVTAALDAGKAGIVLCAYIPVRAENNGLEIYSIRADAENQPRLIISSAPSELETIVSIGEIRAETEAGVLPQLPQEVEVTYNTGRTGLAGVVWELGSVSFDELGQVTVYGTVAETQIRAMAVVTVKKVNQSDRQNMPVDQNIYVQGGAHANLNPTQYASAPAYVEGELRIKNSNSNQAYSRRVYISYDLTGMKDDFHKAEMKLRWKAQESQWSSSDVYLLNDSDFREDTITWNSAPAHGSEPLTAIRPQDIQDEEVTVDITEAVRQALADGKTAIGFMIENGSPADTNGLILYSSRGGEGRQPYLTAYKIDIISIADVELDTVLATAPQLPQEVTVQCYDGSSRQEDVIWETISPDSYASVGNFTVQGRLKNYINLKVQAVVNVKISEDYKGKAYYVSSSEGDDNNDGLTPETAWASLSKVNSHGAFLPGDQILLKKGDIWNEYLRPQGNGVEGMPITLSGYGEGGPDLRPVINGGGTDYYWLSGAVMLRNQEYWEIIGLEVTNIGEGETWGVANKNITARAGIMIWADDQNDIKDHIYIRDCYVHEVTSFTEFVGDLATKIGGITIRAGNQDPDLNNVSPTNKAGFNHVRVENNVVIRTTIEGIRNAGGINTDIAFRNNYIQDVIGDGIVLANGFGTQNVVEKNVVVRPATKMLHGGSYYAGVWVWQTNDVLFQYNAVYGTLNGSGDGEAFDADMDSARTIFQYNYSQYNSGGVCLFMQRQTDTVFRYNVSVNDGWRPGEEILNAHSLPGSDANTVPDVYNNTFYVGRNTNLFGATGGNRFARFRNNIVIVGDGVTLQFNKANLSTDSLIENNIFWYEGADKQGAYSTLLARTGRNQAQMETAGNLFADPMLKDPRGALEHYQDGDSMSPEEARQLLETDLVERLRGQAAKFEPLEGSPAIGAGTPITLKTGYPENVTKDIMGRAVDANKPSIGALEPKPVLEAPVFTKDLAPSMSVDEDGTVALSVQAAGEGVITYQWFKNGEEIPQATDNVYTLTNAGKDDAGEYKVRATAVQDQHTLWTDSAACVLTVLPAARYSVSISVPGGNGSATADRVSVKTGSKVIITLLPDAGYKTGSVAVNGIALEKPFGEQFELIVEEDVTITVMFEKADQPADDEYSISIKVPGGNGSVKADRTLVKKGEKVMITMLPDAGFKTGSVTINGTALMGPFGGKLELTAEANMEITVVFEKIDQSSGNDQKPDDGKSDPGGSAPGEDTGSAQTVPGSESTRIASPLTGDNSPDIFLMTQTNKGQLALADGQTVAVITVAGIFAVAMGGFFLMILVYRKHRNRK